jgi:hypothetical protein
MQEIFNRYAAVSLPNRIIARLWPILESGARHLGAGNKLIVTARHAPAGHQ